MIVRSQPSFWTQGCNPRGSTNRLDICPGHCAESLSGQVLGTYSSIVRKLFLAEHSFELFVIIFLAISDPDKYWPGHRNVWVRLQVSSCLLPAVTQLGQLLSCPLSTSLTQHGKETRLWVLSEFCWQRAGSQQAWVGHTLYIPERSLALDQFLRHNLFTLEIFFPTLVSWGHARLSAQTMWFMVGALGHMVPVWPLEGLETKVSHIYTTDIDPKTQVNIFGCHMLLHESALSVSLCWEMTKGSSCVVSPGSQPVPLNPLISVLSLL